MAWSAEAGSDLPAGAAALPTRGRPHDDGSTARMLPRSPGGQARAAFAMTGAVEVGIAA
jgi:hypothetical protein